MIDVKSTSDLKLKDISNSEPFPDDWRKINLRSQNFMHCKNCEMLPRCNFFRNWQYKDIDRKILNNQHHTCILEANYYLSVCNVHFS